jgi:excisionase family DNA binding protein
MSERVERRFMPDRRFGDRGRASLPQLVAERRAPRRHGGRRRTDLKVRSAHAPPVPQNSAPFLLTVDEVAAALRTTRKAVYAMIDRGYIPGLVRVRRRILVRQAALLQWLQEKGAPSLRETER